MGGGDQPAPIFFDDYRCHKTGPSAAATTVFLSGKALGAAAKVGSDSGPIVETSAGRIRGLTENKIYTFNGIRTARLRRTKHTSSGTRRCAVGSCDPCTP